MLHADTHLADVSTDAITVCIRINLLRARHYSIPPSMAATIETTSASILRTEGNTSACSGLVAAKAAYVSSSSRLRSSSGAKYTVPETLLRPSANCTSPDVCKDQQKVSGSDVCLLRTDESIPASAKAADEALQQFYRQRGRFEPAALSNYPLLRIYIPHQNHCSHCTKRHKRRIIRHLLLQGCSKFRGRTSVSGQDTQGLVVFSVCLFHICLHFVLHNQKLRSWTADIMDPTMLSISGTCAVACSALMDRLVLIHGGK